VPTPAEVREVAGASKQPQVISEDRYKHFMRTLYKLVQEKYQAQSLEMSVILTYFKKTETNQPFSEAEIESILDKMQDENKLMRSGDTIFFI